MSDVHVLLESGAVPGLVLKWGRERKKVLVTYEVEGRVATEWLPADRIAVPAPE